MHFHNTNASITLSVWLWQKELLALRFFCFIFLIKESFFANWFKCEGFEHPLKLSQLCLNMYWLIFEIFWINLLVALLIQQANSTSLIYFPFSSPLVNSSDKLDVSNIFSVFIFAGIILVAIIYYFSQPLGTKTWIRALLYPLTFKFSCASILPF